MILAVIGLAAPVAAVWLWLESFGITDSRVFRGALAFGCALGLSSVSTMFLVASGIGLRPGAMAADLLLWTALAATALGVRPRRSEHRAPAREPASEPLAPLAWFARGAFLTAAVLALGTVVAEYIAAPHGQWDAWAIWNQKARFLLRDAGAWRSLVEIDWSNPGHPLLLPASVARLWAYAGGEPTLVPAMVSVLFGISNVAVVMAALGWQRPHAWMAGTVALVPGSFVSQAIAQQADIPVAFFILTALVLIQQAAGGQVSVVRRRRLLLLAGLLGGFAAWTKNEGFLLLAVEAALVLWLSVRHRALTAFAWWLLGTMGPLLVIAWFKFSVAPVTPVYLAPGGSLPALVGQLFQLDRHALIGDIVTTRWWLWGGPWATGLLPLTLLAGSAWAFRGVSDARLLLAAVLLMLCGYDAVYLASSLDLAWLVSGTVDRLVAQLWPAIVLAAFCTGPNVRL
jgi:hypothetical protein